MAVKNKKPAQTPADSACKKQHIPNAETTKVLRNSRQGKNIVRCENIEDMWAKLGI